MGLEAAFYSELSFHREFHEFPAGELTTTVAAPLDCTGPIST